MWKDNRHGELMDPTLAGSCSLVELMLFIQIALLCVQEYAGDRPSMSDVVSMLSNERTNLSTPKQPAFSTHLGIVEVNSSRRSADVSFSAVEGR
ncbi:hypothetical protein U1Q18_028463 [Sarracenia purpurea var. burkii]